VNDLGNLFRDGQDFPVDLEHLMEDIQQIYTFEEWRIPIVENVDNFIDEKNYHTILFEIKENVLKIEMKGTGIHPQEFNKLPTIAFTTKAFSGKEDSALGRYGWGLKATLIAAERLEIETKLSNNPPMKQEWYWNMRRPQYKFSTPTLNLAEDSTVLIYHLKREYASEINEKNIIETLQEFYPTLLAGAPALGRKRNFFVNRQKVHPPDWLSENNYEKIEMLKDIYIDGETIGGKIFISKNELPENLRGLFIIVCGRKIEKIYTFSEVKHYTGYVHADIFAKRNCLVGDKTQIKHRDNPIWVKFKSRIDQETERILKEANLIKKSVKEEREVIRRAYNIVARVLKEMPELKNYGIVGPRIFKGPIYLKGGEERVTFDTASSTKTDLPRKGESNGVDQLGGDRESLAIKPDESGQEKARRFEGKLKGYPEIIIYELNNDKIEAEYLHGKILVNKNHPLYKFAEKNENSRTYHVTRAALETIMDYLLKNDLVGSEKYFELRNDMIYLLGGNL
jgi:hypothetical protein